MKKIFFLLISLFAALGISSCTKNQNELQKWEYKIISVWGEQISEFWAKDIPIPEEDLNKLGDEGWELIDVYTRIQTVHPNFGNDKYVTGLQPNTRTQGIFFVFKRPKIEVHKKTESKNTPKKLIEPVDSVPLDSI